VFSIVALVFWLTAAEAAEPAPPPVPAPPAPTMQEPPVWLGVFLEDAADGGVQVLGLVPGGPADRSGVRAGDVLLGVGGVSILDLTSLNETLRVLKPGQRAEVRLLRDGKTETLGLLLGDRKFKGPVDPGQESLRGLAGFYAARFPDALGVEVVVIPADLRTHYGAPPDAGALVVKLDPDGPGANAGLKVGDVLVRAGTRPVEGPADLSAGLVAAATAEVPLEVVRARRAVKVLVPRPAVSRPAGPSGLMERKTVELAREVERLRARVAELEAELARVRRE
jgi:predicted metalloprotease with PDZ domain